jgi:hypothetical protein
LTGNQTDVVDDQFDYILLNIENVMDVGFNSDLEASLNSMPTDADSMSDLIEIS